jgi:adenylate cyclase
MLLLGFVAPQWSDLFEGWTVDLRFLARGPREPQNPIVIVALDETSFQSLGDLGGENIRTWPRRNWAALIEKITAGVPAVIAIDPVFDTPGWDQGGDQALAEALARGEHVVLAAHMEHTTTEGYSNLTYSPPISVLAASAAGVGVANTPQGTADDVVRTMPLLWPWQGQVTPAFGVVTATLYQNRAIDIAKEDLGDDFSVPVNYRGPEGTFETVSMIDVWQETLAENPFEDAIVLVGFTTELEQDRHATPFEVRGRMPGVEIHANLIDNLLTGDWLRRPPTWLAPLLILLAGCLAIAAANLPRLALSAPALSVVLILFVAAAQIAFARNELLIPMVPPITTLLLVGGAGIVERAVFAERDKRLLKQRFAGMMSPSRLDAVMENWEGLRDFNRSPKQAAVLFSDIRGFTHATETLMQQGRSQEMVAFLSRYLDAMAAAVFEEGGVIYRMLGDGLLVMFGMPEPIENEALSAVRAAIRMSLAAENLQAEWPLAAEMPIQMGIGIHHGKMIDSIVGSGHRVDYAIIGDPANTAARIEAYCKQAMQIPRPPGGQIPDSITILISDGLYRIVQDDILADETIPPFTARGKAQALKVVRVLGLREGSLT